MNSKCNYFVKGTRSVISSDTPMQRGQCPINNSSLKPFCVFFKYRDIVCKLIETHFSNSGVSWIEYQTVQNYTNSFWNPPPRQKHFFPMNKKWISKKGKTTYPLISHNCARAPKLLENYGSKMLSCGDKPCTVQCVHVRKNLLGGFLFWRERPRYWLSYNISFFLFKVGLQEL